MPNYSCDKCSFFSNYKSDYNRHLNTKKHMENMKNVKRGFTCEKCEFNTLYKKDYERHMNSKKHMKNSIKVHVCSQCNKEYLNYSGLWKHEKQCMLTETTNKTEKVHVIEHELLTPELFVKLLKENTELKNVLIEQNRELQNKLLQQCEEHNKKIIELSQSHTIVNNNNNNNNQFNLNIFLHEKCKNAINLVDFVENLKITFNDLENVGNEGYVNGITQIFMKGLKELDLYTRPVHCTDVKRETLYIREQNEWIKEDPDLLKIKDAIKKIAFKNIQQISSWNELHPDMQVLDSDDFKLSFNIMQESLGGPLGTDIEKNNEKIVKNIAKTVYIDKQQLI